MPFESNVTVNDTNMNTTNNQWLHQLWKNSAVAGGPKVFIPGGNLASIIPWMENGSDQNNSGTLPPSTTLSSVTLVNNIDSNLNRPPTRRPRPTRRPSLPTAHPVTVRATTPRPITFDQYGLS